ncbi:MAG: tetratricopeptide repeat protein [Phycisphaerae bacterium]|nr:tetratricopeptide repeat protein [Phycisphaerae bacterium]
MDAPRRIALSLLAAGLATLSACNQQRPIHAIRAAAEAAYDKGDYELARAEYEQLVERYPGDPTARYGLGMSCLKTSDPMKAREQLAIAYEVDPTRDEVIDAYCLALYEAKEQDTLMTFLRRLSLERGQINDFLRLGTYSAWIGNADEAVSAFKTAKRLDAGKSTRPLIAIADFYASVNDRPNQVKSLRQALSIDLRDAEVNRRIRDLGEIPGPSFAMPVELE